jgi:hypothetical protein
MTLILLTIFVAFATISPNFARTVPMLISTYTLEKGEEKVLVRHVKVEQINTQELGETIRECNGPGIDGFLIEEGMKKMNEFKLDWNKCKIMNEVDTLKITIFYTKTAENDGKEYEFIAELHNQERIKTNYTFNMNLHGDGGRRRVDEGLINWDILAKKGNEEVKINSIKETVENGNVNDGGEGGWQNEEKEKAQTQMVGKGTVVEEVQQKEKTNSNMVNEGKNTVEKGIITAGGGNEEKEKPKDGTKQMVKEDEKPVDVTNLITGQKRKRDDSINQQVNVKKENEMITPNKRANEDEKLKEDVKPKEDEKHKDGQKEKDGKATENEKPKDGKNQVSGGMNASERQKLLLPSIWKFDDWMAKKGETNLPTNTKNNRKTSY